MRRRLLALSVGALLVVTCTSCDSDGEPSAGTSGALVRVVAGGGDDPTAQAAADLELTGAVYDLAVRDGAVYAVVDDGENRELLTVAEDGAVTWTELPDGASVRYVAVGPDGDVYVAGSDAVYGVEGSVLKPEVVVEGAGVSGAGSATTLPRSVSIGGVAVDGEGRLVWSAPFIGTGPDEGSEPVMTKVFRLADGEAEHVAGSDVVDLEGEELEAMLASPPSDMKAVDVPLDGYATGGELAAGDDGSVYVAGPASVLRLEPDGGVEAVLSDGERAYPEVPYGDVNDASGFGGSWVGSTVSVSDGTVAVVDTFPGLDSHTVDAAAFAWGGDLSAPYRELADRISRGLADDEPVDADDSSVTYGTAAVVVRDGQAATAMTHVAAVALDGDQLYAVGATAETGPASTLMIVSTPVPDDWG